MTLQTPLKKTACSLKVYSASESNHHFLEKINQIIHQNIENETFNSEMLSRSTKHSRAKLFQKIKEMTGLSTTLYIRWVRLERSRKLLCQNTDSIREIAFQVGFSDLAYYSRCFKQTYGITPSSFRNNC